MNQPDKYIFLKVFIRIFEKLWGGAVVLKIVFLLRLKIKRLV